MKNLHIKILVLLGIVIVALGLLFTLGKNGKNKSNTVGNSMLSSQTKVARIADSGFGKLSSLAAASNPLNTAGDASVAQPQAGNTLSMPPTNFSVANGSASVALNTAPASQGSSRNAGSAPGKSGTAALSMPAPIWYSRYVYKGDTFQQNQSKLDVLKRVPVAISADQAVAALQQLNTGLVDLGSFGSTSLNQLIFSQNQDLGYTITLDLKNGTIGINPNGQKWSQNGCMTNAMCVQPQSLKVNDIPVDDVIIAITDQFLKDHNIPTNSYSRPIVQNQWRNYLKTPMANGSPTSSMPIYFPYSVTVIYQQMLNGKPVYEQGGTPSGLNVEVNLSYSKVSSVYGLSVQNYQTSSYDAITEVKKIIQIAENGGQYRLNNYYGGAMSGGAPGVSGSGSASSGSKVLGVPPNSIIKPMPDNMSEVALGTPQMAYVKMYDYQNGINTELYAPAFVFPLINAPQNYYQQNVIVPLIWDLISNPYPLPLPLKGTPKAGTTNNKPTTGTGSKPGPLPVPLIVPTK